MTEAWLRLHPYKRALLTDMRVVDAHGVEIMLSLQERHRNDHQIVRWNTFLSKAEKHDYVLSIPLNNSFCGRHVRKVLYHIRPYINSADFLKACFTKSGPILFFFFFFHPTPLLPEEAADRIEHLSLRLPLLFIHISATIQETL